MQRKKSRFWLFVWSFIPGAGEMYMGFMKMGVSLMLGFAGLIAIVALTNIGALAIFPVVMYFYSFFHANNLGALDNQTFYGMRDQYLFGMDGIENMEMLSSKMTGKRRTVIAAILVLIGLVMLWEAVFSILCDIFGWDNEFLRQVYYFVRDDVPRFVIGIAVIWIGIAMIRGKQEDIVTDKLDAPDESGARNMRTEWPLQNNYAEQNRPSQNSYAEQNRPPQNNYVEQNQLPQNSYAEQNRPPQNSYAEQNQPPQNSYAEQNQP